MLAGERADALKMFRRRPATRGNSIRLQLNHAFATSRDGFFRNGILADWLVLSMGFGRSGGAYLPCGVAENGGED